MKPADVLLWAGVGLAKTAALWRLLDGAPWPQALAWLALAWGLAAVAALRRWRRPA